MADHHDGAAPMGASDHRVFDMTSAALGRGEIHDLVVECNLLVEIEVADEEGVVDVTIAKL